MEKEKPIAIYELSLNVRIAWQAHSLSNSGNNGTNRMMPRRQLLADGTEVDAISGNIQKHYHAALLAERFKAMGIPLCPACAVGNGQRVAALLDHPDYKSMTMAHILQNCGLCDLHGFLVTGKKAAKDDSNGDRQRLSKHSLVEFSFGLAIPDNQAENPQLFTRMGGMDGNGQMLYKNSVRSGSYAVCARYKCVGIGMDTESWDLLVTDETERYRRHQASLKALRDFILSPSGAMTSTLLPHLTGIEGAVVVRTTAGRAPVYSPLVAEFVDLLVSLQDEDTLVMPFITVPQFNGVMTDLANTSRPFSFDRVVQPNVQLVH